ncbi:tyrosinase [Ochrobactrum sp. 695/2009]|nr:tyrosinase family protein [Brucella intermedia]PJR90799.1 tyrosinase [Ochrobactrum sp. 721/2009]PJT15915.1 tyrosinase [Ochrobactrum sp. 720/2009]PJT25735.1 tyrosinase [Ochrobactrum sp. 715/2009]PJT29341.1 tyrosinase [Ochrobactrum sp. 695/2009]PJT35256.1 tyrosinase [Ochrobactrum sp. 689/2009]
MTTSSSSNDPHSRAQAKYRRHNVFSVDGHAMLASYKKGIQVMLDLPARDPRNWFRYAFIHFLDCPHGNWWFPVWHRVYLYWFEKIIRELSEDPTFTLPYWDWSQYSGIPDSMFEGVLTPTHEEYRKYTKDIDTFTAFIQPDMRKYWNSMNAEQLSDMNNRGYSCFQDMWLDMLGCLNGPCDAGNRAFAETDIARYQRLTNPDLDDYTKASITSAEIENALAPQAFYSTDSTASFSSPETASHSIQPSRGCFSSFEIKHNLVHNSIGGVGPLNPGPYANMANFLSPVDPIFYLHHANIDRLWDVWARKQTKLQLQTGPTGANAGARYYDEQFLFFFNQNAQPVAPIPIPIWYHDLEVLDYDYAPGTGENIIYTANRINSNNSFLYEGVSNGTTASVNIPSKFLDTKNGTQKSLVVSVGFDRPDSDRNFDVLVNAPQATTSVTTSSPYYGGSIAFFGPSMSHMAMSSEAIFTITLPRTLQIYRNVYPNDLATLTFKVVPSGYTGPVPPVQPLTIKTLVVRAV